MNRPLIDPARFNPLPSFGGPLQRGVFPIVAKQGNSWFPAGTGFMVNGNGLMITAAHVIRYAIAAAGARVAEGRQSTAHCELYALYVSDQRHGPENQYLGGPLPIDQSWFSDASDIAICQLRIPLIDGVPLRIATVKISPGLPSIGDQVCGFGYHQMNQELLSEETSEGPLLQHSQSATTTNGKITELHELQRDRGFLRFPCFRTDAHFAHGMSGGPVFNASGLVCGVITSGSTFEDESYASLIYMAFACSFEASFSKEDPPRWTNLCEFAELGLVKTDESFEKLAITTFPSGKVQSILITR